MSYIRRAEKDTQICRPLPGCETLSNYDWFFFSKNFVVRNFNLVQPHNNEEALEAIGVKPKRYLGTIIAAEETREVWG